MANRETAQRIDAVARTIAHAAWDKSTALLRDNRAALGRCAQAPLHKEIPDEVETPTLTAGISSG